MGLEFSNLNAEQQFYIKQFYQQWTYDTELKEITSDFMDEKAAEELANKINENEQKIGLYADFILKTYSDDVSEDKKRKRGMDEYIVTITQIKPHPQLPIKKNSLKRQNALNIYDPFSLSLPIAPSILNKKNSTEVLEKIKKLNRKIIDAQYVQDYLKKKKQISLMTPEEFVKMKFAENLVKAEAKLKAQNDNKEWDLLTLIPSCEETVDIEDESDLCKHPDLVKYLGHVGMVFTKGRRSTMEDAHLGTVLDVTINEKHYYIPLYGIFDGHGQPKTQFGSISSNYMANGFHTYLETKLKNECKKIKNPSEDQIRILLCNILKTAFVYLGEELQEDNPSLNGGTTAVIAFIFQNKLWVSVVGDSSVVLSLNGKPVSLSLETKPMEEVNGVTKRGGIIVNNYIEWGTSPNKTSLAPARSVGHREDSGVNPRSKVFEFPLDHLPEGPVHLIIYCDGLGDVASKRQIVNTVFELSQKNHGCTQISQFLVEKAYATKFTVIKNGIEQLIANHDNISVMVVDLKSVLQNLKSH